MQDVYDVAIIGSGPAGLTAAIYTSRGAASTIIFGGEIWGGQLMLTTAVDNFPSQPGIDGPELMKKMRDHATLFGAEFVEQSVSKIDVSSKPFKLMFGDKWVSAKSIVIATGAETMWLNVPGEEKLRGKGVSSCAPCDAPFFKDKIVGVVGGGDSAMEEALVLTKYASKVTIIHRKDAFKASAIMQKKVMSEVEKGIINIIWDTEVVEMMGEQRLEKVKLRNTKDGKETELSLDGLFVAIGHTPMTDIFKNDVELDEKGYIKNNGTQTNIPGIFVSGDVHDHTYKQAITAAGFGCMAGLDALKWLSTSE